MGGGGGGSVGGGVVVGGPSPSAAYRAGLINSRAASAAANAVTEQTNTAINFLRSQYNNATMALKPYTMEGIQALNELNQYLGMSQGYNPGTAPRAPTAPTLESLAGKVNQDQVRQYIMDNTQYSNGTFKYIGTNPNNLNTQKGKKTLSGLQNSDIAELINSLSVPTNTSIYSPIQQAIAQRQLGQAEESYQSQLDQYNQQMDVYNYAKAQNEAYRPLTPEEVSANLAQTPGYQFQLGQGMDAIQRAASSKGMLNSGRLLQSLADYGQGLASQTYGQRLQQLSSLAGAGQNAATASAQGSMNLGNTGAGLTANLGDTIANSYLAGANSLSQGLLAANQQYQVIGGGGGGGGGMGGIGQALGAVGSIAGLFAKCSRTLKDKINTPSKSEILNSVKNLNIDVWKYKGIDGNHIGPYAEEFRDHFNVGDGKTINIIDALGVLFASVQELSAKLDSIKKEA
jgi:hypothetical protein